MSIKLKDTIYDLINRAEKDGSGNTITSTYLKLSGGTLTGNLTLNAGNEDRFLKFQYNNGDTYGWRIGYLGSGSGDANYLVIQTSQETEATWTNALRLGNTKGDALFSATVTANGGFIGTLTGNVTGNASSATKLATARTLWGQSFNGTANVSGNMTGVGTISMSGALTLTGTAANTANISFSRASYNYIHAPANGLICIQPNGMGATSSAGYHFNGTEFFPGANNTYTLGTSSKKWKNVYATTFTGSLSGNASSSTYTTNIRITSTNPTSATTYNPIWAANSSATSDGSNNYTPRANNGFSYITLEGTTSALGYGIVRLGNSTASGTAGNKYGILRLYSESSGYVNIRPGTASTSNYTLYLPGSSGQLVYHTNDTQIGKAAQPVYVTSGGEIAACSISAGSSDLNRCLMVTNENGMYYTPSITGNYLNGALISTVSDTTTVRHTCTNSNGSISLYAATNRGLYDSTNSTWIIYLTKAADHVYVLKWAGKGSSTAPVYFNSSGEPVVGSTYAGGTKVTLNGTAKGGSTASFYAVTSAGAEGQYLVANSSGVPSWKTISPYNSTKSRTANTVLAAPNGSNGTASFRKLVAEDLPTMYWADVAISSSSSTTKEPTFASISLGKTDTYGAIYMLRDAANYIKCGSTSGSGGRLAIIPGGQNIALAAADLIIATNEVYPGTTNVTSLGTSSYYWKNTYSNILTSPKLTYSGKLIIDATEIQLKYNDTSAQSVVLTSTAFKPFTAATGNIMLGNYTSLWKGLYTSISTSSTLNKLGINYCDSNGYILSTISCGTSAIGIYSTGKIYLRGGCTKSTSTNTIPSSSGTGVVIDASGNTSANSFTSTVATGTKPITVTSTTKCTNLNADLWDGYNLSVVSSMPSSPSSTTIYIVT